jgi:hypothetical protein
MQRSDTSVEWHERRCATRIERRSALPPQALHLAIGSSPRSAVGGSARGRGVTSL